MATMVRMAWQQVVIPSPLGLLKAQDAGLTSARRTPGPTHVAPGVLPSAALRLGVALTF